MELVFNEHFEEHLISGSDYSESGDCAMTVSPEIALVQGAPIQELTKFGELLFLTGKVDKPIVRLCCPIRFAF
jgi:hypothetical protein